MTRDEWLNKCAAWKDSWPVYLPEHADDSKGLNIYEVLEAISTNLGNDDIVMADAGSPSYACPTNLKSRIPGQFVFNPSQADMGWAVPASVGASLAAPGKNIIAVVGDGSFYSNMQEMAVIKHHDLPVRLFVLNNDGYLSIRNTQSKYYEGRVHGVDASTGLTFPPLELVANAFGFEYHKVSNRNELLAGCGDLMHGKAPALIEIICAREQEILPAQALKTMPDGTRVQAPLHDMAPFMSQEELDREWPGY